MATGANGKIYAVGGFTGADLSGNSCCRVATVEEYDPASNTWSTRASTPSARAHLGFVAASNGKLYAIGGSETLNTTASTVEYVPSTDTWTANTSMPTARWGLGLAAAMNGKLYAIGGGGPLGTNEEATIPGAVPTQTPPAFLLKWGTIGTGDGEFNQAVAVAVAAADNVYVVDQLNHRIQKFTNGGALLAKWGSAGSGDGRFSSPSGVAVDASSNVYVADSLNYRIQRFGSYLRSSGN